jgi:urease accessory protein
MHDTIEHLGNTSGKPLSDGRLELSFQQDPEGRSYLAEQYFTYPFHVCCAQYMDKALPDMATLYLQSCSGGIFKGDRLTTQIYVKENARAHITTQASTIIHRMEEGSAHQVIAIDGEAGALIEYLPDCAILFPQAKLRSSITVTRHPECHVIVGDSFLAHDPDGDGKPFDWFESELVVRRPDNQIDVIDRFVVMGEKFNVGEYRVHGTFAVISNKASSGALLDAFRIQFEDHDEVYAGISSLPNISGCWIRYLAVDGVAAKRFATALWAISRESLTGHPPSQRRK